MKINLPKRLGKGAYISPATRSKVILFESQSICTSIPEQASMTEEWDEVDLSNL